MNNSTKSVPPCPAFVPPKRPANNNNNNQHKLEINKKRDAWDARYHSLSRARARTIVYATGDIGWIQDDGSVLVASRPAKTSRQERTTICGCRLCPRHARSRKMRRQKGVLSRNAPKLIKCARCQMTTGLHLDHITPLFKGGDNSAANLQWLCADHHREKTALELQAAPNPKQEK